MKQTFDYSEKFLKLFSDKVVGVLGLGITGMSCLATVQSLARLCVCFDDNVDKYASIPASFSNVITANTVSDEIWSGIDILILSPGIVAVGDRIHPLVDKIKKLSIPIISDVEMLFVKYPDAKYIGITGTNGKSTVTSMTAHILQSCGYDYIAGGNIGVPCMNLPKAYGYVLEVSCFQLELLKNASFAIVIITNLTPDHLDRYGNLDNYYLTKLSILNFLALSGVCITNFDHKDLVYRTAKDKFSYSLIAKTANTNMRSLALFSDLKIQSVNPVNNLFASNLNAFFAALACRMIGCSISDIEKGIESFRELPHRMQNIGTKGSITFINDSKATNVESTLYAFAKGLPNIYWLAGGRYLGADLSPLLQYCHTITKCYFFGESKLALYDLFVSAVPCSLHEDLEDAFQASVKDASVLLMKSTILLSPAHKSFDQFKNFEERGLTFINLCKQVIKA